MESHPYRQAFADRDLDRVVGLLADDVVFHSPVINAPGFKGRSAVAELHGMIFEALSDVEYTHEFGQDDARVLIANARMLGKPLKATLLMEFHPNGEIREIWVMVRPLTGAVAVAEAIGIPLTKRVVPKRVGVARALDKVLGGSARLLDRSGGGLVAAFNRSHRLGPSDSRHLDS